MFTETLNGRYQCEHQVPYIDMKLSPSHKQVGLPKWRAKITVELLNGLI